MAVYRRVNKKDVLVILTKKLASFDAGIGSVVPASGRWLAWADHGRKVFDTHLIDVNYAQTPEQALDAWIGTYGKGFEHANLETRETEL